MPKAKKRVKQEENNPEFKCRFETFLNFLRLISLKTSAKNSTKNFALDCAIDVSKDCITSKFHVSNWGYGEVSTRVQGIKSGRIPIGDVVDVIDTLSNTVYGSKDVVIIKTEQISGKGEFLTIERKTKRKITRIPLSDISTIDSIQDLGKLTITKKGRIATIKTNKVSLVSSAYFKIKADDIGSLIKETNYFDVKNYPLLVSNKKIVVSLEGSTAKQSVTEIPPIEEDGKVHFLLKDRDEMLVYFKAGMANIFDNIKGVVECYLGDEFLILEQNYDKEIKNEPALIYMITSATDDDEEQEYEETEDLDELDDELDDEDLEQLKDLDDDDEVDEDFDEE